ncbi:MAG: tRNA (guanosine(37)-N1)-methyltransferase TrmD [Anaerolineales bacterium]
MPDSIRPYLQAGVLGKGQQVGRIEVHLHNIRDWTTDRHRTTDDEPFGGGGGMVMKPEPVFAAVESVLGEALGETPVILLTPQGRVFTQEVARQLASSPRLVLICGRYEGIDERVRQHLATDEISIGDFVLTGGELPAMVVVDAVARLITGVLGDSNATTQDSHAAGLLEHPHYTRPAEFRGWRVPEVLVSGDHARVAAWRREQSLRRTRRRRPDLLAGADLSEADIELLSLLESEEGG